MKTSKTQLEQYWKILAHLDNDLKKALIERLTNSVKKEEQLEGGKTEDAFGAWEGKESAEDLIEEIKLSRTFTRKTEDL